MSSEPHADTPPRSRSFALRGIDITGFEPDEAMAAMARRRCAGLPVEIQVCPFERAAAANFPLVFSAQAWHWIDPVVRCDRAADILRPGGVIALFWNGDRIADRDVQSAVDEAAEVFRWERTLTRADYRTYLTTHSHILRLDDATRTRLLAAIGDAVPDDVHLAEDTVLYLATRTP